MHESICSAHKMYRQLFNYRHLLTIALTWQSSCISLILITLTYNEASSHCDEVHTNIHVSVVCNL